MTRIYVSFTSDDGGCRIRHAQATLQTTFFVHDLGQTQRDPDGNCRSQDDSLRPDKTIPWEDVTGYDVAQFDIKVWMVFSNDSCAGPGTGGRGWVKMTYALFPQYPRDYSQCYLPASGI